MPEQSATNATLTREYVCAKCWGALVEFCEAGRWLVACPSHRESGFVTRSWTDRYRARAMEEYYEVGKNYPDLLKPVDEGKQRAALAALYGQEDF